MSINSRLWIGLIYRKPWNELTSIDRRHPTGTKYKPSCTRYMCYKEILLFLGFGRSARETFSSIQGWGTCSTPSVHHGGQFHRNTGWKAKIKYGRKIAPVLWFVKAYFFNNFSTTVTEKQICSHSRMRKHDEVTQCTNSWSSEEIHLKPDYMYILVSWQILQAHSVRCMGNNKTKTPQKTLKSSLLSFFGYFTSFLIFNKVL
jgi:hypothetical protein